MNDSSWTRRVMSICYWLAGAAVLCGIDQWVKELVRRNIEPGAAHRVIGNFLFFTYLENTGAAWSMLQGFGWLFMSVTGVVAIAAVVMMIRHTNWVMRLSMMLVTAGGLGNFIDRLRIGAVTDFIECHFGSYIFPVFNFADMCIFCGSVLLGVYVIFLEPKLQNKQSTE